MYFEFSLRKPLGLQFGETSLEIINVIENSQAWELGVIKGCEIVQIGIIEIFNFKQCFDILKDIKSKGHDTALILLKMPPYINEKDVRDFDKKKRSWFSSRYVVFFVLFVPNLYIYISHCNCYHYHCCCC